MELDPTKLVATPLFAGVAGALVALRFAPGATWGDRSINVLSGSACAGFIAPAAGELFKLTSSPMLACLSFFLGMFGMSIAAAIMQGFRDLKVAEILSGWLSRGGKS
jgi:hypothetical protein